MTDSLLLRAEDAAEGGELVDTRGHTRSERRARAPLLVPVDGSRSSFAALRVAAAIAEREGTRIEAMVVEPPMLADVHGLRIGAETLRELPATFGTRLERIRRQLCAVLPGSDWALHVEFGRVAPTIARLASDCGAGLIIVGLSGHVPSRRRYLEPLAGRVIRHADVPVLAVEARTRALPHTVVVGVDFGESSVRAARAALDLIEPPGKLVLIHVRPSDFRELAEMGGEWTVYEAGVREALGRLRQELQRVDVTSVSHAVDGRVSEVLLDVARREGAAAVAVGSHGPGLMQRLLVGSVPLQILRMAEMSVLVAPPSRGAR